jgi:hypothetical protein
VFDGISDVTGKVPGYFGYKFLESPGQPYDGIDNDNDGLIDERQDNGIDEDGDWNAINTDIVFFYIPITIFIDTIILTLINHSIIIVINPIIWLTRAF